MENISNYTCMHEEQNASDNHLPPLKAIKLYCKECCGDDTPKLCTVERCSLYPYRLGKNPFLSERPMTEKQKQHLFQKK